MMHIILNAVLYYSYTEKTSIMTRLINSITKASFPPKNSRDLSKAKKTDAKKQDANTTE